MARQDLEYIATTLGNAVEAARTGPRLQHGALLRAAMFAAIARGEKVDHYRMEWLVASVARTLAFAKTLCKEFDNAHPDDMASAYDLADILKFTLNQVVSKLPAEKEGTPS